MEYKTLKFKASELPNEKTGIFDLPALTAGIQNQGLNNYVPRDSATIFKNVISVSANGENTGTMFYQTREFTVLQDAYVIDLIKKPANIKYSYLYLIGALQRTIRFNYSWSNKARWERIKTQKIMLPTLQDGGLAFEYMEEYISVIETQQREQINSYLNEMGLLEFELSDFQLKILEDRKKQDNFVKYKNFYLKDLFYITPTKSKSHKASDNLTPIISNTSFNNGVARRDYIEPVNDGNVITFSDTTNSDKTIFYQKKSFVGYSHVQEMSPKFKPFDDDIAMYFITSIKKAILQKYDYGTKFNRDIANETKILLPVSGTDIDFDYMREFIIAIKKTVIGNLSDNLK